jgi:hypothetical protein
MGCEKRKMTPNLINTMFRHCVDTLQIVLTRGSHSSVEFPVVVEVKGKINVSR